MMAIADVAEVVELIRLAITTNGTTCAGPQGVRKKVIHRFRPFLDVGIACGHACVEHRTSHSMNEPTRPLRGGDEETELIRASL